jgi:hypothetical protein
VTNERKNEKKNKKTLLSLSAHQQHKKHHILRAKSHRTDKKKVKHNGPSSKERI